VKNKFTKGPWEIIEYTRGRKVESWIVSDAEDVIKVEKVKPADAQLISAAPEMYDLLASTMHVTRQDSEMHKDIKTLLSKARGES